MRLLIAAVLAIVLAGCASGPTRSSAAIGAPAASPIDAALAADAALWPAGPDVLRTTDAGIYLGNLDARIGSYRRIDARQPSVANSDALITALYHRYKVLGRLADAEEALTRVLAIRSDAPEHRLLAATVLSGFHRFTDATRLLEGLDERPELATALARLRADLAVATGDYDAVRADLDPRAIPVADPFRLAHRADLRLLAGDLDAAERWYRAAQGLIRDVDPVPVAWLHTQMGIALLRSGRIERAREFFAAAVARLPGYALAEEHLAECDLRLGNVAAAVARYRTVVARTGNPEFMAALSVAERALGDNDAADAWRERARRGYEQLLARHPDAYAAHAAEFYLAQGAPGRALALAERNRETRHDVLSELLLARAAAAEARWDQACAALQRADATGLRPPEQAQVADWRPHCAAALTGA